ncbi:MAG: alpha/beta fold hydrolase [Dehalococcoidia bacterium]
MSPAGRLTEVAGLPAIIDGPARARATFVLAHGAGAGMEHPFMNTVALAVAAGGIRVVRFEFPYMAARREGRRPGPDRPPVLIDAWQRVVAEVGQPARLVIGGKSMGGRIATMVADDLGVAGLVCLGYPFHPAGRFETLRVAHLEQLTTPALFLQGERDTMGSRAEVEGYRLSRQIDLRWLPDGDHSFKPRKTSGVTEAQNLAVASEAVVEFIERVTA